MARTARSLISPYEAERRAIAELARIGAPPGRPTKWKRKPPKNGLDMGYARPFRLRGKRRKGQHSGHQRSRTSRSGKKKA